MLDASRRWLRCSLKKLFIAFIYGAVRRGRLCIHFVFVSCLLLELVLELVLELGIIFSAVIVSCAVGECCDPDAVVVEASRFLSPMLLETLPPL